MKRARLLRARRTAARRGIVMMAALVALVVVASLSLIVSRSVVSRFRQQRLEEWKLQARWLAVSALERAAAIRAADPQYRGETWAIDSELLGHRGNAVVMIEVNEANRVVALARFPDEQATAMTARTQSVDAE